jgi:hypothetical protein
MIALVFTLSFVCPPSDSMTVRNAHALVYDTHRGVVLLVAGADERQVLGDLWQWDADQWKCLSAAALPPRTFPSAVYDERRRRVIVFGGNRVLFGTTADSNTFLNDHWEWTGTAWEQFPGPTPPARAEAAMALTVNGTEPFFSADIVFRMDRGKGLETCGSSTVHAGRR